MSRRGQRSNTRKSYQNYKSETKKLNKQTKIVTVVFTLLFCCMIGFYIRFLIVDGEDLARSSKNQMSQVRQENTIRGSIYADGKKLAYNDTNNTEEDLSDDKRVYPYGKKFAHVVGYSTRGTSGLEGKYDYDLTSSYDSEIDKIKNEYSSKIEHGADLYTTLDFSLQKKSYNALKGVKGGVFAMDPSTGRVLADVSFPAFNPNKVKEKGKYNKYAKSKKSVFLNRSTMGLYTPGSVFKIFTTLEFFREDPDYSDFGYDCNGSITIDGRKLRCFNGIAHGHVNLKQAFAKSCNSAFSKISMDFNTSRFEKLMKEEMFNTELKFDFDVSDGQFEFLENPTKYHIAQTCIGQGQTLVSPAHMCMVASSIANDGVLMKPHIVDSIKKHSGEVVKTTKEEKFKDLMTSSEASRLKKYMREVCNSGTASVMSSTYNYTAYGKTGTAELGNNNKINSWFVGFAKKGDKQVAIAVCLEKIPQGSASATNIVKEIFDSYF